MEKKVEKGREVSREVGREVGRDVVQIKSRNINRLRKWRLVQRNFEGNKKK